MGILGRMVDLVNANINDLLDKAENPEKTLKQIIRDMEDSADSARIDLGKMLADGKRIEREMDAKGKQIDEWSHRAEMAVDGGEDELARKALERKNQHEKELEVLQTQLSQIQEAGDQLKDSIKKIQDKTAEARAKFTALAARGKAAKTTRDIQKKMAKLADTGSVVNKLDRFERRVEDVECQVTAQAAAAAVSRDIEQEFADREKKLAVESELAALKAKRKA